MAATDNLQPHQMPGAGTKPGPDQGQLFDAGDYASPPDISSPDDWIKQHGDRIAYHGTFRDDWQKAPVLHAGPIDVASERLHNVAKQIQRDPRLREGYYSGETTDANMWEPGDYDPDEGPWQHTGRVHAVRMTQEPHPGVTSDEEANLAHYSHLRNKGYEHWEVPGSVTDSVKGVLSQGQGYYDEEVTRTKHTKALDEGRGVRYRNYVEQGFLDPSLTGSERTASVAIPRGGHSTWEEDVLTTPGTSELARNYARQRMSQGTEGSVVFPEAHVKHHGEGPQTVLEGFPAEHRVPPVFKQRSRRNLSSLQFTTTEGDEPD